MANTVTKKTQLSHGVWVVPDGDNSWGGELNDNFVLLNGLLDRKTLTFTKNAQTVATFNGTQNVTVDIGTQFATNDDIDGIFGDSQTQPDLTKDVNVGNLDRFKTDLSSRVVSSVSLDNNDDLEVTYLDGQSHTVSLPWPEIPTVPVSVVDGAIVDTNKLELTFSDQTTKQLTLPSGGSSPVTRTVTRVPVYFEIHFKVGAVAESSVSGHDECTADSVLGITAQDVKDIVRVSSEDSDSHEEALAPEGIIVTDVTSTKAYDEFDKVFLVAVNIAYPFFEVSKGASSASIKFGLGMSFGNITISDSTIIDALNQETGGQTQSFDVQIAGGSPQLSFGPYDCSLYDDSNYFEITAYLDNQDLSVNAQGTICNDWFGYRSTYGGNCSFKLQVINKTSSSTPVTFTVSE